MDDAEPEMDDAEPEMDDDEPEMDDDEPEMDDDEPEMMESAEPTLAEKIAAAVQTVLDEDAALEEGSCGSYNEEDEDKMEETTQEEQLEEITKAVVARLRSMNK